MSYKSSAPGVPLSLVQPQASTAAARRAIAGASAANSPPSGDAAPGVGFNMKGKRFLHMTVEVQDIGAGVDWTLWTWDGVAELWRVDMRPNSGTGVVTLEESDLDNPQANILDMAGIEWVYVELSNFTGTHTDGVNVWLSSSDDNE